MLWAITKKEFLSMVLRSQFVFASAIILVLVVLGVGMLLDEYTEDVQDRRQAESIQRARMSEAEDMDQVIRTYQVERPIPRLRPIAGGSDIDDRLTVVGAGYSVWRRKRMMSALVHLLETIEGRP